MVTQPAPTAEEEFTVFMRATQPKVLVALAAAFGPDAANDASAEAFTYAWEHWDRVAEMENAAGYVYRVGRSRIRPRRLPALLPPPPSSPAPLVEPKLAPALSSLSRQQRIAVVLTEGVEYSQQEVADLLGVHPSSIRRHRERGLRKLRRRLGVTADA
jgi:DNA-directed RNA polymerase specialized sigma24 family protein